MSRMLKRTFTLVLLLFMSFSIGINADAATRVNTKTTTKTSTKKVKLSKAATKTSYSTKTTTKTSTKSRNTSSYYITDNVTVVTKVTTKFTKKSKYKTITTVVKTTTRTTTKDIPKLPTVNNTQTTTNNSKGSTTSANTVKGPVELDIDRAAPKADPVIRNAFKSLGFKLYYDNSVNYAGYCSCRDRKIIVKNLDDTVYHELGHFYAFLAGNIDKKDTFINIYNSEKGKYNGVSKNYVTSSVSEYFAESYRDYVMGDSNLRYKRPNTYNYVKSGMTKITSAGIERLKKIY